MQKFVKYTSVWIVYVKFVKIIINIYFHKTITQMIISFLKYLCF